MSQCRKSKPNKNNKVYLSDLKSGNINEDKVFNWLNQNIYKEEPLEKSPDKYSVFDFVSKEVIIELKSRNVDYRSFRSTMIGLNKIKYANKLLEDLSESVLTRPQVLFLFLFKDGLYQWELNNNQYYTKMSGRKDRGAVEQQEYAYISIDNLTLITDKLSSII
tara:strand:+ start:179 stop:667 length:489 start_codon:yes stop_codon:yes gene_type:complete